MIDERMIEELTFDDGLPIKLEFDFYEETFWCHNSGEEKGFDIEPLRKQLQDENGKWLPWQPARKFDVTRIDDLDVKMQYWGDCLIHDI